MTGHTGSGGRHKCTLDESRASGVPWRLQCCGSRQAAANFEQMNHLTFSPLLRCLLLTVHIHIFRTQQISSLKHSLPFVSRIFQFTPGVQTFPSLGDGLDLYMAACRFALPALACTAERAVGRFFDPRVI